MPCSNWIDFENQTFEDNKFSETPPPISFAGYLNNKDHPFTYCPSLTHNINGVISNKFSLSDGPIEFEKNLKVMPEDWHYRNKKIVYNVNSSGYRTYEWKNIDWKSSIVIFGCSNTFGTGLAEDETISHCLENLTNRQVINLGFPSGSNELIIQNSTSLIENFDTPYAVVINWSTPDRFRHFTRQKYIDVGPWNIDRNKNTPDYIHELFKYHILDEFNLQARNFYLGRIASAIWKNRCKYISFSYFGISAHYTRADAFFEIDNKARDCIHPGVDNSREVAEYILKRLNDE